ncbi:D-alanine--D-alanine ligase family protein [Flavilitoribacter nigricans]|uniref:D-alanine--D-alanine ligase n=1 Tax=Flavilitoribacter nigricans (strain ATCC 23147 / DSM 23189 / NBRC 102662 / NCIMB 1420 / SS-2) TaxID=1122177 RepID=A0A2D0NI50_FLAN2|nr:D-alanine--D-alanine ligase family protein [Flavilitoribacter nigricans]PHN08060.1 D-alanine--D-alanine ligase [Flavilitoribacter nigricans DSM 23189 = NBRC 102662]
MKIKIAVFFGGRSVEHEVSVISALQAIDALDKQKYEILPVYISKTGRWLTGDHLLKVDNYKNLKQLIADCDEVRIVPHADGGSLVQEREGLFKKPLIHKVDLAFPILHGTFGEDGAIQGVFELMGIAYVGCNVLSSAVGMDKITTKMVLRQNELPVLDYVNFYLKDWLSDEVAITQEIAEKLSYPLIVKPANTGSSVGISKVNEVDDLRDAVEKAASFSRRILVEPMVTNLKEINCSVLGDYEKAEASPCEEPLRTGEILSYQDKYVADSTKGMSGAKRKLPADLPEAMSKHIQELAIATFKALDCAGVARIDFLIDETDNSVYVNEINAIPGSLSFYLWKAGGKSYPQLLDQMISVALKAQREKNSVTYTYEEVNLFAGSLQSLKLGKAK